MTQGATYIFCIQDEDYNFYKVVGGVVSLSAQPYFLDFSPAGWDDIAIKNGLNKRYWGIDRSVSIPLAYVRDAADILKNIDYKKGCYEQVYLLIGEQQLLFKPGIEYGFWYEQLFRGEIDLSAIIHSDERVTAPTLEDGLPKYLKANENTTEEIPEPDIKVKMDGIVLQNKVENFVGDGFDPDINYNIGNHLIDLTITIEDAPYVGGKKNVPRTKASYAPDVIASGNWFLQSSVDGDVTFDYDFTVTFQFLGGSPTPGAEYRINIQKRAPGASTLSMGANLLFIPPTGGLGRFNQTIRVHGTAP